MRIIHVVFLAVFSIPAQAVDCNTNLPNGATRADLNTVLTCLNTRIDETSGIASEVDGKLSAVKQEVDDRLSAMTRDVDGKVTALETGVDSKISRIDGKVQSRLTAMDQGLKSELSTILTRIAEIEKSGMSKRVKVANRCLVIDRIQMCWGSQQLAIPSTNRHTRSFDFTFEKPFADAPRVITNGVNANTKGKAFAVFEWKATPTTYSGLINNVENDNATNESVTMNFFAIGQAGSW